MLSQLKKDLARMQNEYSIDDAIIYNVNMETVKESFLDVDDFDITTLSIDDNEMAMIEKLVEEIPPYTNEADMDNKLKRIVECYIPTSLEGDEY